MDLDSFILHSHCLYRVRPLSFPILKISSINASLGQTSSFLRSLLLSITYKHWLFVCSFQQPPMPLFLLQTPSLPTLLLLACFSSCIDGFSDDQAQLLSSKNWSLTTYRGSDLTKSECSTTKYKQRAFLSPCSATQVFLLFCFFCGFGFVLFCFFIRIYSPHRSN